MLKRIYEDPSDDDGYRVLVDRLWPRWVSKEEARLDEFVVATETGILYRMEKENPDKEFYPANEDSVCEFMKMITLEKVHRALKHEQYEVRVPDALAERAKKPIERMLQIS
ncbi:MAG: quinolinate synthase NadA [Balneolaceae bacterium]|nr:quinolinate synthase NadA [Balneolaceae bacterium]